EVDCLSERAATDRPMLAPGPTEHDMPGEDPIVGYADGIWQQLLAPVGSPAGSPARKPWAGAASRKFCITDKSESVAASSGLWVKPAPECPECFVDQRS